MPSNRFTKTNVDKDTYGLLQTLASAKGISVAQLIEVMLVEYLVAAQ